MGINLHYTKSLILLIALTVGVGTLLFPFNATFAQTQPERFWLAGRYDGNRVVVYFDAVQFNGTVPPNAKQLLCPVVTAFFCPVELQASYIARFQKGPNTEHFALGDKYDLILEGGGAATVTLTTLVGFASDEAVGNDSYIGALATLEKGKQDWLYLTNGHYALRRHREPLAKTQNSETRIQPVYASLLNEPVRFDIQSEIVALLSGRMKAVAINSKRPDSESTSPIFEVKQFRLADGSLRYYARAAWKSGKVPQEQSFVCLGAWIAPLPKLHILAVESAAFEFSEIPNLLNVIDLGGGKTGMVVSINPYESVSLNLMEYRDGVDLTHMRTLQIISAGE